MGFNYLQTDDRDDYLAQFGNKPKRKAISVNLIGPNGDIIMEDVPAFKIKAYAKKNYLPLGKSGKYIWRNILISKGYKVTNNY